MQESICHRWIIIFKELSDSELKAYGHLISNSKQQIDLIFIAIEIKIIYNMYNK